MRFMHGFSGHTFKAIRGDGSWNYIKYLNPKGSFYGANVLTGSRHSPTKASVLLASKSCISYWCGTGCLKCAITRPSVFERLPVAYV